MKDFKNVALKEAGDQVVKKVKSKVGEATQNSVGNFINGYNDALNNQIALRPPPRAPRRNDNGVDKRMFPTADAYTTYPVGRREDGDTKGLPVAEAVRGRLQKGSQEAKDFMAKIRAKRGKSGGAVARSVTTGGKVGATKCGCGNPLGGGELTRIDTVDPSVTANRGNIRRKRIGGSFLPY